MPEPLDQRDLLIRYLLGAASAAERTNVEEQCFADESGAGVLLRAEDELIDDYVRGALSASDRRLFESHFLCTEGRKQRLATVQSLVGALRSVNATATNRPTAENFARLLNWLDSDHQRAAEKFENIRDRLSKLFAMRGVNDVEALVDETIDRVAARVGQLVETYIGDPAAYFFGVARMVMFEAARTKASASLQDVGSTPVAGVSNQESTCLEKCLAELSERDRDLILQFYAFRSKEGLVNLKELARSLGISVSELRVRALKTRRVLERCVKSCLQREDADKT